MKIITNKIRGPIQVMVRSRVEVPGSGSRAFTTLVIPGVGSGNNEYPLEDERYVNNKQGGNIDTLLEQRMVSVRTEPNIFRKED